MHFADGEVLLEASLPSSQTIHAFPSPKLPKAPTSLTWKAKALPVALEAGLGDPDVHTPGKRAGSRFQETSQEVAPQSWREQARRSRWGKRRRRRGQPRQRPGGGTGRAVSGTRAVGLS